MIDNIIKGLIGLLIVVVLLGGGLISWMLITDRQTLGGESEAAAAVPSLTTQPTQEIVVPEATTAGDSTTESGAAPDPVVELLPSSTPIPTSTPVPATNTPVPTDTPPATATPLPPTATRIPPTALPPPPATATPVPPSPTPQPQIGINGLVASSFFIQDRAVLAVNQEVWFEFTVINQAGGEVSYNALGVMPKKDGVDRKDWYQQSYGGANSTIKPSGLSWEDRIKLPESGNYTLRLVICFDGIDACLNGNGTFHTLSQEIPVTIN